MIISEGGDILEPKIVHKDELKVVGMPYYGNNSKGEISQIWGVFCKRMNEIKNKTNFEVSYGVCDPEVSEDGKFHYTACVEVSSFEDIPEGMVTKVVPEGRYAVFTYNGPIEKIGEFYKKIYKDWLPNSEYEVEIRPDFEYYDKRFCQKGELDIYVPIK